MALRLELRKSNVFQFLLTDESGNTLLISGHYGERQDAEKGIVSVRSTSSDEDRYEIKRSDSDRPYFILKAADGQVIARSQSYSNSPSMNSARELIKREAPNAPRKDLTGTLWRWLFLGAFLAAASMWLWRVTLFGWSALPYKAISPVYDGGEVARFLEPRFPESGTYMLPSPHDDPDLQRELRETGPAITLNVRVKQDEWPKYVSLLVGFGQYFGSAFLAAWILRRVGPTFRTYRSRASLVAIIGFAAVIACDLTDGIWCSSPWKWIFVKAFYDATAWAFAGLVLAAFVKPPSRVEPLAASSEPT